MTIEEYDTKEWSTLFYQGYVSYFSSSPYFPTHCLFYYVHSVLLTKDTPHSTEPSCKSPSSVSSRTSSRLSFLSFLKLSWVHSAFMATIWSRRTCLVKMFNALSLLPNLPSPISWAAVLRRKLRRRIKRRRRNNYLHFVKYKCGNFFLRTPSLRTAFFGLLCDKKWFYCTFNK